MIRVIYKSPDYLVQKVYNKRGKTLRYQAVKMGCVGDASQVTCKPTLTEACEVAGIKPGKPSAHAGR